MRTVPFPLVGGSYADESKPWSMQDTVNYLPTMAERDGTRTPVMLKTPPGLRPYLEIPGTGGGETPLIPSKPVRGTYEAEGKFFAVIGTAFYRISNAGVAIPIGTVPGLGRVSFAHNQIPLGNEVVIMNGSAGYCYNTVTETFARITDRGFPGSAVAGFIDGMILGIEPQGRYAFNSRPAAATDYNTLDRFTSEVSPDRLVTLGVVGNDLLLLSTSTGEFFEDQGHSEQPFRSKRISFDIGCAGPYAITALDNNLAWLGSDGFFYRLENGYGKKRISTRPIEQAIRGLDWWQAFAFNWKDSGYDIAYFTFPDGRTWGFDAANGWEPARRESYELLRWRVNSMTRWNDEWYAGDFQTGRIWKLDWDYILEGDQEFVSERTCAVMHDNQNLVRAPRLELVMDTGQQETVPAEVPDQPSGPSITGAAPSGEIGEPYSFQYTVQEGDATIVKTVLRDTSLPTGWHWNESTATISCLNPLAGTTINLSMRVYDTNGLYDDHSDTVEVDYRYDFVTIGGETVYYGTREGVWADSVPSAVESSSMAVTWGKRVIALGPTTVTYSDDYFATPGAPVPAPWSAAVYRPLKTASGRIYALAGDENIYYSDDGAETWVTVGTDASDLRFLAGAEDDLVVVDYIDASNSGLYRTDEAGEFPFLKAGGAITAAGYGDGMVLVAGDARWSEDACDTLTPVSTPSPGGDSIECYCTFRTSGGAWLMSNRVNSVTTDQLIARSSNGKSAFNYVTTPAAKYDGTFFDVFAERKGVVVSQVGVTGGGVALAFLHSSDDGESWNRHNHTFSDAPGMTGTIAAFPEGAAK